MCRCVGSKNIGFLAGKCTFLVTEEGMLAAVETQNIGFLAGKWKFLVGGKNQVGLMGPPARGGVIINKE